MNEHDRRGTVEEGQLPDSPDHKISQYETDLAMEQNPGYLLGVCMIYAVCFSFAFYRNYMSITFPLLTLMTIGICCLFLKKSKIGWKRDNWYYAAGAILLGISTMLSSSIFTACFNTIGILILLTVFMMRQIYDDKSWNIGQYICNILFFYLCTIPEVFSPFADMGTYIRSRRKAQKNKDLKYILYGMLLGIPMLFLIIWVLSSADIIFSNYIGSAFRGFWGNIAVSPDILLISGLIAVGFFGSYAFLSALTRNNIPEWKEERKKKNPITAITFLTMITAVYLIFCAIQILFLFTGGAMLPEGYTYAGYAHQGFFQLLFICIFNLILVTSCNSIFGQNRILKILLLICSGCTYIMTASSAYRMILYIKAYHLTFLRILVLWFLGTMAVLMAGVVAFVLNTKFRLFPYSIAVITICYVIFSFAKADYWIAKYNIEKTEDSISYEDLSYLCTLSADAAPAMKDLKTKHIGHEEYVGETYVPGCPACRLGEYFARIKDCCGTGLRKFNLSKYLAVNAAEQYWENNKLTIKSGKSNIKYNEMNRIKNKEKRNDPYSFHFRDNRKY